jgi:hypothetical protein
VEQSFIELKIQLLESSHALKTGPKTKLVFYSHEQHLVSTIAKAKLFGIDLSTVPAALYSPDLH